jgi:hypothetical protein
MTMSPTITDRSRHGKPSEGPSISHRKESCSHHHRALKGRVGVIILTLVSAMAMASLQTAAADSSRKAFVACLHDLIDKAKADKVTADGFGAFAEAQCGAAADSFKSAMVGFDVKNKVPRKRAEADAQSSIDDYLATAADRYTASISQ